MYHARMDGLESPILLDLPKGRTREASKLLAGPSRQGRHNGHTKDGNLNMEDLKSTLEEMRQKLAGLLERL